jgi:hypothetical protein
MLFVPENKQKTLKTSMHPHSNTADTEMCQSGGMILFQCKSNIALRY